MKVGLIGVGFVGEALKYAFEKRQLEVAAYDKYKNIGKFEDVLQTDLIFLCLPTLYQDGIGYDLEPLKEVSALLQQHQYQGPVIIKSTVGPGTSRMLADSFKLDIVFNPEFLTERTRYHDADNQALVILGFKDPEAGLKSKVYQFYQEYFAEAKSVVVVWEESESVKIMVNNFYACKVQIFNEFYFVCQHLGISFDHVRDLMLELGWINPMHTKVPGPDGQFSFGGHCFTKDNRALRDFMEKHNLPSEMISAAGRERDKMRRGED